jgi:hypothetical protein
MWEYQQYMQLSLQFSAESLFEKLDPLLEPQVFLIGILVDNRDDRHPVCIEPEDCGYSVDRFSNIKEAAEQFQTIDEENGAICTHPIAHQKLLENITDRSYSRAIKKILENKNYQQKKEFFVASSTYIEGYKVFTVLTLNKNILQRYYSLTKEKEQTHFMCPICRSFIDSVAKIFLNECSNALKSPDNSISVIRRGTDELLREAGKKLMETMSWAGNNGMSLGLYHTCNEIAAMKYEGSVSIGNMIIASKEHSNIRLTLELINPIRIGNYRTVRKFLELSENNTSIISDSAFIYGLGEIRGKYNPTTESLFTIKFLDHY